MPKYSKDTIAFDMKITNDGRQLKVTIPGVLYQRLHNAESIVGSFVLSDSMMCLKEEYRVVTPEQLCSVWQPVPDVESIDEINEMDLDDLLMRMGFELQLPDDFNKNITIADWDSTTYDQFHVSFQVK